MENGTFKKWLMLMIVVKISLTRKCLKKHKKETKFKLQKLKNNIDQTKKICTMQKQKFYFLFKKIKLFSDCF